jgi:hypothetical protein
MSNSAAILTAITLLTLRNSTMGRPVATPLEEFIEVLQVADDMKRKSKRKH